MMKLNGLLIKEPEIIKKNNVTSAFCLSLITIYVLLSKRHSVLALDSPNTPRDIFDAETSVSIRLQPLKYFRK